MGWGKTGKGMGIGKGKGKGNGNGRGLILFSTLAPYYGTNGEESYSLRAVPSRSYRDALRFPVQPAL